MPVGMRRSKPSLRGRGGASELARQSLQCVREGSTPGWYFNALHAQATAESGGDGAVSTLLAMAVRPAPPHVITTSATARPAHPLAPSFFCWRFCVSSSLCSTSGFHSCLPSRLCPSRLLCATTGLVRGEPLCQLAEEARPAAARTL